jgi:hypothetical protein
MFFVANTPYTRTIRDPESDATAEATMRPLNAGDQADLEDTIAMGADGESVDVKIGLWKLLSIEKALISWTLPQEPSASSIRALHPAVVDQLATLVTFGAVPPEDEEEEGPFPIDPADATLEPVANES